MERLREPFPVETERVWRTYTGGKLLEKRDGNEEAKDSHYPEEWILSTVEARNPNGQIEGLSRVKLSKYEGTLADLLLSSPGCLGRKADGVARKDMGVLTKIIDSRERLTIQVHPDKEKAEKFFHSPYGKTECWHILGRRNADSCIYYGFCPGITRERWVECFETQNIPEMLNCLNRVPVSEKETYLIPGGVPHAIGPGCLLIEIQEPTDYTLRTEKMTPQGQAIADSLIHQGIGVEQMLDCFDYTGMEKSRLLERYQIPLRGCEKYPGWQTVVGYPETDCFSLFCREITEECTLEGEVHFYGLYIWSGKGKLQVAGNCYGIHAGTQFFVPAGSIPFVIHVDEPMKVFRIEGPR